MSTAQVDQKTSDPCGCGEDSPKSDACQSHIITRINNHLSKESSRPFYSFEYYPPKTNEGVVNLYGRIERMAALQPLWVDVTWDSRAKLAKNKSISIVSAARSITSSQVMLHITCAGLPLVELKEVLDDARQIGIRNICALSGDSAHCAEVEEGQETLTYASELVTYIRANYADFFCIAVAGYPEVHGQSSSVEEDIKHLKHKVDCGADFIITQQFYDAKIFLDWQAQCRTAGITCPIVPGIMPIQQYNVFAKLIQFGGCTAPAEVTAAIEKVKHNDAAVKAYGIQLAAKLCRQLFRAGVPGVHFYTLNLERSIRIILEKLGLTVHTSQGELPWSAFPCAVRQNEKVRPIYWSNRPLSYLDRTNNWDEFPNGRWGDSSSPAFGEFQSYHIGHSVKFGLPNKRRAIWGQTLSVPMDVFNVFAGYIKGTVAKLPWCEAKLQLETTPLKETLVNINLGGFLTINSQPRVNGASSSDVAVGWGGPGGFVYQKAYLEFFTSGTNLQRLVEAARSHPSISYDAVDYKGDCVNNLTIGGNSVNALTWGVFPNSEVKQPTVADHNSFLVWKDEAFSLWKTHWQSIYKRDSESYKLLGNLHNSYYLVTVVENDYVNGDIFAFFNKLMDDH